jgi:hypothetical protein
MGLVATFGFLSPFSSSGVIYAPYKPYLTFAGRLVAELVAPGPFNPTGDVNAAFEYGLCLLARVIVSYRTQRQH